MGKHYHLYATANDDWLYRHDFLNIFRMFSKKSGVASIRLYLAISLFKPKSIADSIFIYFVTFLFRFHSGIELVMIQLKNNVGRDFSSWNKMWNQVKQEAKEGDFIFFQNRSARGPFMDSWYTGFIKQYQKFPNTALCGSTINFKDHPTSSLRTDLPHVQTYSFLSEFGCFSVLDQIPGHDATNRLELIQKGEIYLSQFFLDKGHSITCIEWPDVEVVKSTPPLSTTDEKVNVIADHYFLHRKYFEARQSETSKLYRRLTRGLLRIFKPS